MESGGSFERPKHAKDLADSAYEKADPTAYSVLPPAGAELRDTGIRLDSDHEEKTLHESDRGAFIPVDQEPVVQQFVARLLKGIVNVSDVVSVEDERGETRYFSRVMPLDKIDEPSDAAERRADAGLLATLFFDGDHGTETTSERPQLQNYREEGDKHAFYDFGIAEPFNSEFRRYLVPHYLERASDPEALAHMERKLGMLANRLAGDEGKDFVGSLISQIDYPMRDLLKFDDEQSAAYLKSDDKAGFVRDALLSHVEKVRQHVLDSGEQKRLAA